MPVLLRQYLKLDALMVVDLVAVDRRILARTMGEDGAGAVLRTAWEEARLRTPALSGN